jgi:chromosome segregation protein
VRTGRAFEAQHREKRALLETAATRIPQIEQALRDQGARVDAAAQQVTALEARIVALTQIQDRIARSENMQGWLESHGLTAARHLWQDIEIEAGWEDALEAALRERLNGIGLASSAAGRAVAGRSAARQNDGTSRAALRRPRVPQGWARAAGRLRALQGCGRCRCAQRLARPGLRGEGIATRDWRVRTTACWALLVSGDGHMFTRHSVSFHAPDSELHGVLSRQREIELLTGRLTERAGAARGKQSRARHVEAEFEQQRAALDELRAAAEELQQQHHAAQLRSSLSNRRNT